ncbi:uncharacterized protein LOC143212154 isoform X2 [Lasioglossum baleicum]|uniref:uncharacterized protein LOC143212154 isoform X2 n=1 Tax=Lasioglossum baleicum TaxID=434251 RepID=UPI003FCD73D1
MRKHYFRYSHEHSVACRILEGGSIMLKRILVSTVRRAGYLKANQYVETYSHEHKCDAPTPRGITLKHSREYISLQFQEKVISHSKGLQTLRVCLQRPFKLHKVSLFPVTISNKTMFL